MQLGLIQVIAMTRRVGLKEAATEDGWAKDKSHKYNLC